MKKYLLSAAVISAFVFYVIRSHVSAINTVPPPDTTQQKGSGQTTTGQYKDGEYTGSVVDAFYGLIQVKAVISQGNLTDVQFLQYPNDQHEWIQVNTRSNPLLKAEAIQAQSAQVDIVSGATQSSEAFVKSLASALAQAK